MRALALVLLVACNGCHPRPDPVQPRVYGDDASDVCVQACAKLSAWSCPEARPTPAGERCESFCARTPFLNASCVAGANGKSDLAGCGVRCSSSSAVWLLDGGSPSSSNWSLLYDGGACFARTVPNIGGTDICVDGGR